MSLLRACSGALAKPALLRSSLVARALSSEAAPPTPTSTTKEPSEIAPVPQKDVVSADIISGAPGMTVPLLERDRAIHRTPFSRAPPPRRTYIPACPQYHAERWSKRKTLAS